MSYVPASSDRDLWAVLGVIALAMTAVVFRARAKARPPEAETPGEGSESSPGTGEGPHRADATGEGDTASGEAR